jgi:hypothetical protein
MTGKKTIDEFERAAEAAYAAMYEARPHNVKDCHDDAQLAEMQVSRIPLATSARCA